MLELPSKDKLLYNFSRCYNWEERYLYLIELGKNLPPFPMEMHNSNYLITDCQSSVWIFVSHINNNIKLYGDSDAAIVKGLIAIVFIFYNKLTLSEIVNLNIFPFIINQLALNHNLTFHRLQGLESIVKSIRKQAAQLLLN